MSEISNNTYLNLLINSGISSFLKDKPNNLYKYKSKLPSSISFSTSNEVIISQCQKHTI